MLGSGPPFNVVVRNGLDVWCWHAETQDWQIVRQPQPADSLPELTFETKTEGNA